METTIIAHLLGICYLALGCCMFFRPTAVLAGINALMKDKAALFTIGFMTIIIGALILIFHQRFATYLEIFISLLGWVALFKGMALIAYPELMKEMSAAVYKDAVNVRSISIFVILLGVAFLYWSDFMLSFL